MLRKKVFNQIIKGEQYNRYCSQMHNGTFFFTIKYRAIVISSKENTSQENLKEKRHS